MKPEYRGGANKVGMGLGRFIGAAFVIVVGSLAGWCLLGGLVGLAIRTAQWVIP